MEKEIDWGSMTRNQRSKMRAKLRKERWEREERERLELEARLAERDAYYAKHWKTPGDYRTLEGGTHKVCGLVKSSEKGEERKLEYNKYR